jgi:hypothetical protein
MFVNRIVLDSFLSGHAELNIEPNPYLYHTSAVSTRHQSVQKTLPNATVVARAGQHSRVHLIVHSSLCFITCFQLHSMSKLVIYPIVYRYLCFFSYKICRFC